MNAEKEFNATVTGLISEYCKGEGCWLTLENQGGEPLFVEVGQTIAEGDICRKLGIKMVFGLGDKIQSSSWLLKK